MIQTQLFPFVAQEEAPEIPLEGVGAIGLVFFLIYLAVTVVIIAGAWKMFAKAGQPGWGILIPIYNAFLLCKIAGRPGRWVVLYFIPLVGVIVHVIVSIDIAKCFGFGVGFGLGLVFLGMIFVPVLGFGSATYQGPSAG